MNVQIRTSGIAPTADLHDHIERRMVFALGRFADHLESVAIDVADVNGPRGGVDLRCRVIVRGRRVGRLQVEASSDVLRAAIDVAAARIGHRVARQLDRLTTRRVTRRRRAQRARSASRPRRTRGPDGRRTAVVIGRAGATGRG